MSKQSSNKTLQENLEIFRAIYQAIPVPTYTWQAIEGDFQLVAFNKAAVKFTAESLQDKIGIKAGAFYKDSPDIISDLNKCFSDKSSFDVIFSHNSLSSFGAKTFKYTYTFIFPDLILVQSEEISEYEKSKIELIGHNQQLKSFIENSPVSIAMFDMEMRYIATSKKLISDYKLEGYQLTGKSIYEVFPEIGDDLKEIHQRCLKGAVEKREEYKFTDRNGNTYWSRWEIRPWHNATGNISGLVLFTEDITERKIAEEKLVESEGRCHGLFTNSLDGIILGKPSGEILAANPAACNMFGRTEEEMCKLGRHSLIDQSDPTVKEKFKRRDQTGLMITELDLIRKDGTIFTAEVHSTIFIDSTGEKKTTVFIRDISERKKIERLVKDSEEKFKNAFMTGLDAFTLGTADDGRYIEVNDNFYNLFGYKKEEVIGKTALELNLYLDPNDRKRLASELEAKGHIKDCETKGRKKNGEIIIVSISTSIFWLNNKKFILGVIRDITESRKAQEQIKQAAEKTTKILQNLPLGLSIEDKDEKFVFFNDAFIEMFGYTLEDIPDVNTWLIKAFPHEEYRESVKKEWQESTNQTIKTDGKYEPIQVNIRCKDGSYKIIEQYYKSVGEEFTTLYHDITEQKRKELLIKEKNDQILIQNKELLDAKDQIKESEIRFKSIAEQASDGITLTDLSGNYLFVNKAFCNMVGYSEEELLKMSVYNFRIGAASESSTFKKVLSERQAIISRIKLKCKDNTIITTNINGKVITINDKEFVVGIITDVTKEVIAEENLLQSKERAESNEAKLVEAQRAAKVGNWETDLYDLSVLWSAETYKIFDLDPGTFQPTHESFLSFVHPDDKQLVDDAFVNSFKTKNYNSIEHRIITSKGNLKYVEERWKIIFDKQGYPIRTFGTCQDITDRKMVELELVHAKIEVEENEFRLKLAAESAQLGIWDWYIQENKLIWDKKMYEIFGLQEDTTANKFETWADSLHPEDKDYAIQEVNSVIMGKKSFDTTFRILKPDGKTAYIKGDAILLKDLNGNPYRMIGMNRDISKTEEYKEKLKQSEEKHRALIENISDGIVLVDETFNLLYQSPSVEKIVGYTFEERRGKIATDFIHPDDLQICLGQYENARKNPGITFQNEYRTRHKKGYYIWIDVFLLNLLENKNVGSYVVIYRDITHKKNFEEQQLLLSSIVNSSDDAIISKDLDGIITSWNKGAENVLGYPAKEMVNQPLAKIIPQELKGEEQLFMSKILLGLSVDHYETRRIKKDGTLIDASITISPIFDSNGKIVGASKILRDITEQKLAERKLKLQNERLQEIAYIQSHIIRKPVANILGLMNVVKLGNLDETPTLEILEMIEEATKDLDIVIHDIVQKSTSINKELAEEYKRFNQ